MRKVILIPTDDQHSIQKPTILYYRKTTEGWKHITDYQIEMLIKNVKSIVYLGSCCKDGDMFAVTLNEGFIHIYKGELNGGWY